MDWQSYLDYFDAWSDYPELLGDSIPCSQALRIKRTCSCQQELLSHTTKMINEFQKGWYSRSFIKKPIDKANLLEREQLLREKKKDTATTILLLLRYSRAFRKMKEIVMKLASLACKPKSSWNISKSTYFSLPLKQKSQILLVPN